MHTDNDELQGAVLRVLLSKAELLVETVDTNEARGPKPSKSHLDR